jgi:hypothetical protein
MYREKSGNPGPLNGFHFKGEKNGKTVQYRMHQKTVKKIV